MLLALFPGYIWTCVFGCLHSSVSVSVLIWHFRPTAARYMAQLVSGAELALHWSEEEEGLVKESSVELSCWILQFLLLFLQSSNFYTSFLSYFVRHPTHINMPPFRPMHVLYREQPIRLRGWSLSHLLWGEVGYSLDNRQLIIGLTLADLNVKDSVFLFHKNANV